MRADRFTWQGLLLVLLACAPAFAASQDLPRSGVPHTSPITLSSPDGVPDLPVAERRSLSGSAGDSVTGLYEIEALTAEQRSPRVGHEPLGEPPQACGKPRQLPLHETSLPPPFR